MALTSLFKRKKSPKKLTKKTDKKVLAKEKEVVAQSLVKATSGTSQVRRVLLTPLVSEKSVDRQLLNQVVFRVTRTATKGQIAQAVQEEYGVRPLKVRTIKMHPKHRRRGRSEGFTAMWKKAYVTVVDLKPFNLTP